MTIKLIIEAADTRVGITTHELDQSLITFGRSKGCHIELNHPEVSRRHFIIKFIDDIYVLLDEGSRYGTIFDQKKLEPNQIYPIDEEHIIEVPGFLIKFFYDGHKPKLERTTVVARKLLDELLQGNLEQRECPSLQSKDKTYHFDFIEEKTSFVLGSLPNVDFVLKEEGIGKEHASFARDINGIILNPLLGHEVFIDRIRITEPQILVHGSSIKVGNAELIFKVFSDTNDNKTTKDDFKENNKNIEKTQSSDKYNNKNNASLLPIFDHVFLLAFLLVLASASLWFLKFMYSLE